MNICMVSGDFSYPPYGGVAAHIYELSKALVNSGHTVDVVNPSYGAHPDSVEGIDGITVHWLRVSKKMLGVSFAQLIVKSSMYISRLLQDHNIDILHWHDLRCGSLATKFVKVGEIPRIFTNHSSMYLHSCETRVGLRQLKLLLSHANAVISPSEELRDKTLLAWDNRDYSFYIPNGVDADKFRPDLSIDDSLRKKYNLGYDSPIVLCPRRLEPKNGVKYLAESVSEVVNEVPEARFLIVGEGTEERTVSRILSDSGTAHHVTMAGMVTNDKMPSIYSLADIVVLPSLEEATSIAGLESMASGKPLVGTRVGGIPAIIEDGETGLLVPPANSSELARAISRLLLDRELRLSMGTRARKRVLKEFSWQTIVEKTLNVYQGILGDRGQGVLANEGMKT